jgi:hypothetical protein
MRRRPLRSPATTPADRTPTPTAARHSGRTDSSTPGNSGRPAAATAGNSSRPATPTAADRAAARHSDRTAVRLHRGDARRHARAHITARDRLARFPGIRPRLARHHLDESVREWPTCGRTADDGNRRVARGASLVTARMPTGPIGLTVRLNICRARSIDKPRRCPGSMR